MLQKLIIKNVALIDSAEIIFTDGLNVLSGETGAGKSVIIESLNFVLGAKADKTLIRSGEIECVVTAEFDVSNNACINTIYDEFDFDNEDLLIITRKFTIEGRSSIKVNGNSVTAGMLKKFTSLLVDVHGQSEHFNLLKTSNQLDLLDKMGGNAINEQKNVVKDLFLKIKDVSKKLTELGGDESQRLTRLDILNYQIAEIEKADFKENEEEELLEIKQKLIHQEKILAGLNNAKFGISDEGGASDILSNVSKVLGGISSYSEEYSLLYERIESVLTEVEDIADCANSMIYDFDVSDIDPDKIENRLELIKSLKNKYGQNYSEIMSFYNNAIIEKEKLENFNENAEKLLKDYNINKKELYDNCVVLSNLRKQIAEIFSESIVNELKDLGMNKAQFRVSFNAVPTEDEFKCESQNGFDVIEFEFSANAGEPLKPLSMVISGGEMSRFMLSIKSQTAKYNEIGTFIFDEIDAGISGNVAKIVAEKFANISKNVQLIAITHLPQISAMADNNLLIEKFDIEDKTLTKVKTLNEEEKVLEIVRLVGGSKDSLTSIEHAKELIVGANNYKKKILN